MSIIGKAESISYGKAAVKYAEEKKINGVEIAEDFELHALSGQTSEECFNEMRNWKNGTGHGNIKRTHRTMGRRYGQVERSAQ